MNANAPFLKNINSAGNSDCITNTVDNECSKSSSYKELFHENQKYGSTRVLRIMTTTLIKCYNAATPVLLPDYLNSKGRVTQVVGRCGLGAGIDM